MKSEIKFNAHLSLIIEMKSAHNNNNNQNNSNNNNNDDDDKISICGGEPKKNLQKQKQK